MGDGTAWGGRLICNQEIRRVRFPYPPPLNGSGQLSGVAPGLQIRCEALIPSRVGSIPMHFRQN